MFAAFALLVSPASAADNRMPNGQTIYTGSQLRAPLYNTLSCLFGNPMNCEGISSSRSNPTAFRMRVEGGYTRLEISTWTTSSYKACWKPGAKGSVIDENSIVVMQGDGNLVWYDGTKVLWKSNTAGNYGARLEMQADGNAVIYTPANKAIWSSNTKGKC